MRSSFFREAKLPIPYNYCSFFTLKFAVIFELSVKVLCYTWSQEQGFCIFLRDFLLPNCGERVWFWHDVWECKATQLNVTYGQNVLGLTKVIYLEQIYWHENEDKKRIKASFIVNQPENWFFVDRRNNIFSWMIICFRRSASAINF